MNTPDYGPKNGDFVAYLADLERQQALVHGPAQMGSATKNAPTQSRPPSAPVAPAATPSAGAIANPLDIVRAIPLGLVIIGVTLVIAGIAFNGGFILVIIGLVMLASAVRQALKAVAAGPATAMAGATAAQQVTAILKAATQQKGNAKK